MNMQKVYTLSFITLKMHLKKSFNINDDVTKQPSSELPETIYESHFEPVVYMNDPFKSFKQYTYIQTTVWYQLWISTQVLIHNMNGIIILLLRATI